MRAPGRGYQRDNSRGSPRRNGSPPIPAETGRKYSNYSLARIVADIGRSYGPQQSFGSCSEASGGTHGDAGGLRSNHRGIGGMPVAVG